MSRVKPKKFAGVSNLERWKAMHGLRSSNAAQPHAPKNRKGTRAVNRKRAIQDFQ